MQNKIEVKEAVEKAFSMVKELMKPKQLHNLALEEVEFDVKRQQWCVTLGFDGRTLIKKTSSAAPLLPSTTTEETERKYKILRIDAHTGEFLSMKIRQV